MARRWISLEEFVDVFDSYEDVEVTSESFIWRDLGYDLDELQWHTMAISKEHNWVWTGETDLGKYLPYEATIWTRAYWRRDEWADLRLKELYAFCPPYVDKPQECSGGPAGPLRPSIGLRFALIAFMVLLGMMIYHSFGAK